MQVQLQDEPPRYTGLGDFYAHVHTAAIQETRTVGHFGATVMHCRQWAGDWSDPATPDLVLGYTMVDSDARFQFDLGAGRFRAAAKGRGVVVVSPHCASTAIADGPHDVIGIGIPYHRLLDFCQSTGELPEDGDFGVVHADMSFDPALGQTIRRLWSMTPASTRLYGDGLLLMLASHLLRLSQRGPRTSSGGLAPWQLRRVTDYLNAHLDTDISLADLAAIAGRSTFHFARAFRNSTGMPPHAYLRALRCDRAKQLLVHTNISIVEIAACIGYGSSQAFARMFLAEAGMSPSAYRQEKRR